MKRIILIAAMAILTLTGVSAQQKQYSINVPDLPSNPTMSDVMAYVNALEQKKTEIASISKMGSDAVINFLKEESPDIYRSLLNTKKTGKTLAIVGGGVAVAGIGGAIGTMAAYDFKLNGHMTGSILTGACGIVAALGIGIGTAGLISLFDAPRDAVVIYRSAVNDEIARIKSFGGYRAELTFGPTASGVGFAFNF